MIPLGLTATQTAAYHRRLFSSHDYRIDLDILDLNENPVGSATFLDGQINLQTGEHVRRTATLSISDPDGALDFTGASAWSGSTIWVDRLVRIRHTIAVPGVGIRGDAVTVTCFVGPPSKIARQGAEVSVECQDKTALVTRGVSPYTVGKGANAVNAIWSILQRCTGEFRFRLGTTTRRLSRPYSVGWADETSPWAIATAIAKNELGAQLIYSPDGYATLRKKPGSVALVVPGVTAEATSDLDLTTLINWVRVQGKVTTSTKTGATTTTTSTSQPQSVAEATSGNITPSAMARKGVRRYLPRLVNEDAYTTTAQTSERARLELVGGSRVDTAPKFACIPFFHADVDDIVRFTVPGSDTDVRLTEASIPLGPNEMTVGAQRWVSAAPKTRMTNTYLRTRKVTRKKR